MENAKEYQQLLHADTSKLVSVTYRLKIGHLLAGEEMKIETTASSWNQPPNPNKSSSGG